MQDGDYFIIKKKDSTKLIVTYSTARAKKDAYNRERGIRKLKNGFNQDGSQKKILTIEAITNSSS